jgi:hypothetical protein
MSLRKRKAHTVSVDLTDEAMAFITLFHDRTGTTKKEIINRIINEFALRDDRWKSLVMDHLPPSMLEDEEFWRVMREVALAEVEKYRLRYQPPQPPSSLPPP